MIKHTALPLSWSRSNKNMPYWEAHTLGFSKMEWVSLVHLPAELSLQELLPILQNKYKKGLLIRGCTPFVADFLTKNNFKSLPVGMEARLNLEQNIFAKPSLKSLVKRGARFGKMITVPLTDENKLKVAAFKNETHYGSAPKLKHLFVDCFKEETLCFAWVNNSGEWQAIITLSFHSHNQIQTEVMQRKKTAPAGTMEALIYALFYYLKEKGFKSWSLGEVPFVHNAQTHLSLKARILNGFGQVFSFAYNAQTLYEFKNKFKPQWQPVYLCGNPEISYISLIEMAYRSNYLALIFGKINPLKFLGRFINE